MDENMFFSQLMELLKEENDRKTELFLEKYLTWADENKKYEFYIIVCQNLISLYRSIKNLQKAMNVCEDMLMLNQPDFIRSGVSTELSEIMHSLRYGAIGL